MIKKSGGRGRKSRVKVGERGERWGQEYFTAKKALELLGKGALIAAYVVIPGVAVAGKYVVDFKEWVDSQEANEGLRKLKRYDRNRLRQTFKRLHEQKDVTIVREGGVEAVRLTSKGKKKWLRYRMREMKLDKSNWDGKWRLISYDIEEKGKAARDMLRRMLRQLECKQLHHSLYLTPYRCEDEIEYLRQVFGVGDRVVMIVASKVEGEEGLKRVFGLK